MTLLDNKNIVLSQLCTIQFLVFSFPTQIVPAGVLDLSAMFLQSVNDSAGPVKEHRVDLGMD